VCASHAEARQVIDVALTLHETGWSLVAYELLGHHHPALRSLTLRVVERFGFADVGLGQCGCVRLVTLQP
jgi:hypothetical protein